MDTRICEARFRSGPVLFPDPAETNTQIYSQLDWKQAAPIHPEQAREWANPVVPNEALVKALKVEEPCLKFGPV
jgi:hypothetical protein